MKYANPDDVSLYKPQKYFMGIVYNFFLLGDQNLHNFIIKTYVVSLFEIWFVLFAVP